MAFGNGSKIQGDNIDRYSMKRFPHIATATAVGEGSAN